MLSAKNWTFLVSLYIFYYSHTHITKDRKMTQNETKNLKTTAKYDHIVIKYRQVGMNIN